MKIVVMPLGFDNGGSGINAADLRAAVQEDGHDVMVVGRTGPLVEVARKAGLEVIDLPIWRRSRPTGVAASSG